MKLSCSPPQAPDMTTTAADILETAEMEVSSTEESELESDTDTRRLVAIALGVYC